MGHEPLGVSCVLGRRASGLCVAVGERVVGVGLPVGRGVSEYVWLWGGGGVYLGGVWGGGGVDVGVGLLSMRMEDLSIPLLRSAATALPWEGEGLPLEKPFQKLNSVQIPRAPICPGSFPGTSAGTPSGCLQRSPL